MNDHSQFIFIYTSCIERSLWKYESPRNYRIIMQDLGHLSQTLYLVSSWLDLGAFYTGNVIDEIIEEELLLNRDKEIVMGMSGVGKFSSIRFFGYWRDNWYHSRALCRQND
jgi:SagB-type dehydrogenase family enzyme